MKNRETDEWLQQNNRSTRNFIRKWGHFVKHDTLMKPIIPPKYDVGFVVTNCVDPIEKKGKKGDFLFRKCAKCNISEN